MIFFIKYNDEYDLSDTDKRKINYYTLKSFDDEKFDYYGHAYIIANDDLLKSMDIMYSSHDTKNILLESYKVRKILTNKSRMVAEIISESKFDKSATDKNKCYMFLSGDVISPNEVNKLREFHDGKSFSKTNNKGDSENMSEIKENNTKEYTPEDIFKFAIKFTQQYTEEQLQHIFGCRNTTVVLMKYSCDEIIKRIDEYENDELICVGDFLTPNDVTDVFYVTCVHGNQIHGVRISNGMVVVFEKGTVHKVDPLEVYESNEWIETLNNLYTNLSELYTKYLKKQLS